MVIGVILRIYLLENPKVKNFNKQKNKLNKDVIKNEFNLLKKIENNHT